jgi:glyoxylase-like metal-dependent hydrolase (beta-lactamase superfamily II)
VVIIPPEGKVADYLASLRRLQALEVKAILPGHGPAIADPQAKLQEYLDHRMLRERQIVAALQVGPQEIAALVRQIYHDVDPRLHEWAGLSVQAHLLKLAEEGRVRAEGEVPHARWRLL